MNKPMKAHRLPPWIVMLFTPQGFSQSVVAVVPQIKTDKKLNNKKILYVGTFEDCTIYARIYPVVSNIETKLISQHKPLLLPDEFYHVRMQ